MRINSRVASDASTESVRYVRCHPNSDQTLQVKRDGSLMMPHSLPDGTGMGAGWFGSSLLSPTEHTTYELRFPSELVLDFLQWTSQNRRLVLKMMVLAILKLQLPNLYKQFSPPHSRVILFLWSRWFLEELRWISNLAISESWWLWALSRTSFSWYSPLFLQLRCGWSALFTSKQRRWRSLLRRQNSIQVESPFHPARSRVVDIWWWRLWKRNWLLVIWFSHYHLSVVWPLWHWKRIAHINNWGSFHDWFVPGSWQRRLNFKASCGCR